MAREINLVPDIKGEMIKTLKLRNFIFFLCIVVAAVSIGITVVAGLIMGGQDAAISGKKNTIDNLSKRLNSYSDLSEFLTIKDQLGNVSTLNNNKKVLSRTFDILSAIIPTGADTIQISELAVNLEGDAPTFTFDAQANAGKEPFIDYNVLDSFKKSMQYMRYDYGRYVDKNGSTIPAYCMIETGLDGAKFNDPDRGLYAFWTIEAEGCNPSNSSDSETTNSSDANANSTSAQSYTTEEYNGQNVVRIWRTPQYSEWYKENKTDGQPYMSLSGEISNVPHFQSSCITYAGTIISQSQPPKWSETNEECQLVPSGIDGIRVVSSSNGRGADEQLVLRFSAVITLNPAVYTFNNHHMLALSPSGRHNVTDSYVQVQAMFGQRAADCAEGDNDCKTNTTNSNGGN
ncbi:MAG: hypothetical protein Q4A70_00035 [Candidatus Saccharibacteria bacterium]|nr:hypothetical protein [Candidatus Saccharibacteria bacterium]